MRCNLLSGLIDHFSLLKYVNIAFFLSKFSCLIDFECLCIWEEVVKLQEIDAEKDIIT